MQLEQPANNNRKPWYKKWWLLFLIFLVLITGTLFTAFFFYVINLSKQIKAGQPIISKSYFSNQSQYQAEGINNYWIGTSSPQITIVEFADFNCPACKNSYQNLREISVENKDIVKIIFRDYPVIAETSMDLAMAARCAGEQGKFWEIHDRLYQNQGKFNPSSKEAISSLAMQTGVDLAKFLSCMDSKKYQADIAKDLSDGENLEISGTPTWFINGHKITGEIPKETFDQIISFFKK
jgi:protein-disulfide isomerase